MMKPILALTGGLMIIYGIYLLNISPYSAVDKTVFRSLIHGITRTIFVREDRKPFYFAFIPLLIGGVAFWAAAQL